MTTGGTMELIDHILRVEKKLDQVLSSVSDLRAENARLATAREGDLQRLNRLEIEVEKIGGSIRTMEAWLHKAVGWAVGSGIIAAGVGNYVLGKLGLPEIPVTLPLP